MNEQDYLQDLSFEQEHAEQAKKEMEEFFGKRVEESNQHQDKEHNDES